MSERSSAQPPEQVGDSWQAGEHDWEEPVVVEVGDAADLTLGPTGNLGEDGTGAIYQFAEEDPCSFAVSFDVEH